MRPLIDPRCIPGLTRFCTSRCTIQAHDGTQETSGLPAVGDEHFANVAGMVDIPCRKAPLILARPTANENVAHNVTTARSQYQVVLQGEYVVTVQHRAIVDGTKFNITGVEYEHGAYTRLRLEEGAPSHD